MGKRAVAKTEAELQDMEDLGMLRRTGEFRKGQPVRVITPLGREAMAHLDAGRTITITDGRVIVE